MRLSCKSYLRIEALFLVLLEPFLEFCTAGQLRGNHCFSGYRPLPRNPSIALWSALPNLLAIPTRFQRHQNGFCGGRSRDNDVRSSCNAQEQCPGLMTGGH